jgi:regulatory protein
MPPRSEAVNTPGAPGRSRVPSLKVRALQWLAQREYSRTELRQRLLRVAAERPAIDTPVGEAADLVGAEARVDELLDWLQAHRYLCDERFVESRVHARAARYGNLRIRQELAQHRLALPADAEQALRNSELGRAREVWARRFEAPPQSTAERAKQARFLIGRGFSADTVRRVLRGGALPSDDDVPD